METITIFRGDDTPLRVELTGSDGAPVEMQPGDTLTLTVRELPEPSSPVLLQVVSESCDMLIPREKSSQVEPGRYSCDIQFDSAGLSRTVFPDADDDIPPKIVNWKNFWVRPQVTES